MPLATRQASSNRHRNAKIEIGQLLLDQTFSARNFRKISDSEKRKGRVRDLDYFGSVREKTEELKSCIRATKEFRRTHPGKYSDDEQAQFNLLKEKREEVRRERDDVLLEELEDVSRNVNKRSFEIEFSQAPGPGGKSVYVIDIEKPAPYYAMKKLEANISSLYKLKPANRDEVMDQVIDILSDRFPYHVIRTDITSFFESIPHKNILLKLRGDQLLSQKSLRILSSILHRYSSLAGTPGEGLPRGLGISSYLSELYMREFDRTIESLPDVVYSARYVDDIIVIFAPLPGSDMRNKKGLIEKLLRDIGLLMNQAPGKTKESPTDHNGQPDSKNGWSFEYLGYNLSFSGGLSVQMSRKRLERYKNRIRGTFQRYRDHSSKNPKRAYRLLLKRVRYLTSNTQLTHNKQNAYVGIYFSNRHLSDFRDLNALDGLLSGQVRGVASLSLRGKISACSFVKGHQERIFRRFQKPGEFEEIVRAWKYEN
ncbi:antiviral reverse transcriptase Drt3a [Jannaschia seosinensis]|nr:antiviral reverse transcriptase Drt3a [Jannaschia seosinensis]